MFTVRARAIQKAAVIVAERLVDMEEGARLLLLSDDARDRHGMAAYRLSRYDTYVDQVDNAPEAINVLRLAGTDLLVDGVWPSQCARNAGSIIAVRSDCVVDDQEDRLREILVMLLTSGDAPICDQMSHASELTSSLRMTYAAP